MLELTVLVENTRINRKYQKAHGLSLLINYQGAKYLFDTGPKRQLLYNAMSLKESLIEIKGIIISHGHSDHTGGLRFLTDLSVPIYLAEDAQQPHYLKILRQYLYVGMPSQKLRNLTEKAIYLTEQLEIEPTMHLVPLGRTSKMTKNLFKSNYQGGPKKVDDFSDELMLIIEETDGLLVFTGCSHHGILEMANQALSLFPTKKIKALIGGFHLIGIPYLNNLSMPKKQVLELAQELASLPIEKILTCHCTGPKAYQLLKQELGNKLTAISAGQRLKII